MGEVLRCPFCSSAELEEYPLARRFFRCSGKNGCAGVFVGAECRICADKQKERYMFHRNTLDDKGYRSFLTDFADTALAAFAHVSAAEGTVEHASERTVGRAVERAPFAPKNGAVPECLPLTIFDYGCGRGSLLVHLLKEYRCAGKLPQQTQIRGWDPFFKNDTPFFSLGADLVLCLEVAEHFENPEKDFAGLAGACKKGGIIVIRTLFAPQSRFEFEKWWYKEDVTHVSFYTEKAMRSCAERAGLEYCGIYNNCSILRAALPR